ncbi:MAG: hypothetical protein IPO67_11100 [Deltaproteobacteria bacterium]|nr:hypothetical protein [Deltaproteobacteria bacterium]
MIPRRLQRLATGLRERLEAQPGVVGRAAQLARHARPAAELALADRGTLRAWMRYIGPIHTSLGVQAETGYTRLVLRAVKIEARTGRLVALTLPDQLARVRPERQRDYFELLELVLSTRPNALGLVARTLPELMERLSGPALRRFLSEGLNLHTSSERVAESFLKRESERGQQELERLTLGLPLKEVSRALALYARAHCGEDVQVRADPGASSAQPAWSEGRHIHLPERVDRYGDERDFLIYRVLTARTAGYLEFGTFDLHLQQVPGEWPTAHPGEGDLERFLRSFPNKSLARDLFRLAEDARVEARVIAEYPGIARDLAVLRPDELALRPEITDLAPAEQLVEALLRRSWGAPFSDDLPIRVRAAAEAAWSLLRPESVRGVEDVAAAVQSAFPLAYRLMTFVEDGDLRPNDGQGQGGSGRRDRVETPDVGRGADSREDDAGQPQDGYRGLEEPMLGTALRPEALSAEDRAEDEAARELRAAMTEEGLDATLSEIRRALRQQTPLNDRSYDEMVAFLERNAAPEGAIVEDSETPSRPGPLPGPLGAALDPDNDPAAPSFLYPEWDQGIGDVKPQWTRVREHVLTPGSREFVTSVLEEHGPTLRGLRKRFQALRPEALRRVKGLVDGDILELDRAIDARITARSGGSPSERLYTRQLRDQRDVAVAFLLDMSSSTNEVAAEGGKRIIQVEKEALVLIAEAVDAIGDACAIWGFSGYSREHVAFYIAKEFDDAYDSRVKERIGRMSWKMENRDGAAIRHATMKLAKQPARTRLLILLSDGRPLDCGCDQYFDSYAQADTRAALREARKLNIHPFCITVDPRGESYLEALYGEVGYVVIEDVASLPSRLPALYRRLTR